MDDTFGFADEFGPEKVIHIHEPVLGLKAVLVVDNVASGPAIGGVRMAVDATAEEAFRLARAMTFKNAAAGLRHGGGKAVIIADPRMPAAEKESHVRAFARAIAPVTDYIPGPDMGTDETCMAWIQDEIGRCVGLPAALGGIPLDEVGATGFGVAVCVETATRFSGVRADGARIAIQGFGSVGQHAARFLCGKGAVLVAAADSGGTVSDPDGLDLAALIALKQEGRSIVDLVGATIGEMDAVIDADCDIWIPAARPDVIDMDNVDRLKTKLVVEGANIPITTEAEEALHRRGVLTIPDYIANAGGVICGAVEYAGGTRGSAFATIEEKIAENVGLVLESAAEKNISPRAAADALAQARVREADRYRRKF